MKKIIPFLLILIATNSQAQSIVQQMFDKHAKGFRKSLSFVQETGFYMNDSLRRTATWYEVLIYPDKLRIDIDDPNAGNTLFFVNDSVYRFQKSVLKGRTYQPHDLLLVLGGIYSFTPEEAVKKLKSVGYDAGKTYETTWNGRPVIVVGTDKDENESNQFWLDKEKLLTVRILNNRNGMKSEILCEDYIAFGNGWCETSIRFFINGKLRQTEKYRELKENITLNMDFLDPGKMGTVKYWEN